MPCGQGRSVKELILQQFGIKIALRTVGDYLNNWGFTPQRPKLKAYEQNSKAVQAWLEEDYVQIKARAEQENAEIQWADETGVKNHNHHGRSYSPKGPKAYAQTNGKALFDQYDIKYK